MALGLSLRAGAGDARGRRRGTHAVALAFGLFGLSVAALASGLWPSDHAGVAVILEFGDGY